MEEEKSEASFKVVDRRRFTASGEFRDGVAERIVTPELSVKPGSTQPASKQPAPQREPRPQPEETATQRATANNLSDAPPIDFMSFVASMASQALRFLGAPSDEAAGAPDLNSAKHFIDIIVMLQDKTKGNLSKQERKMISRIISDLQMAYVQMQTAAGVAS